MPLFFPKVVYNEIDYPKSYTFMSYRWRAFSSTEDTFIVNPREDASHIFVEMSRIAQYVFCFRHNHKL